MQNNLASHLNGWKLMSTGFCKCRRHDRYIQKSRMEKELAFRRVRDFMNFEKRLAFIYVLLAKCYVSNV